MSRRMTPTDTQRSAFRAAALAQEDLLESSNNVGGWKAIIRLLVNQLATGEVGPCEEAARAAGLVEFAGRVLKTPFATTPMRHVHDLSSCSG